MKEHGDTVPKTYKDVKTETLHRPRFGNKDSGHRCMQRNTMSQTGAQIHIFRDQETKRRSLRYLNSDNSRDKV